MSPRLSIAILAFLLSCGVSNACSLASSSEPRYPLEHEFSQEPVLFIAEVERVEDAPDDSANVVLKILHPSAGGLSSGQQFSFQVERASGGDCQRYGSQSFAVGQIWLYVGSNLSWSSQTRLLNGDLEPELNAIVEKIKSGRPLNPADPLTIQEINRKYYTVASYYEYISRDIDSELYLEIMTHFDNTVNTTKYLIYENTPMLLWYGGSQYLDRDFIWSYKIPPKERKKILDGIRKAAKTNQKCRDLDPRRLDERDKLYAIPCKDGFLLFIRK